MPTYGPWTQDPDYEEVAMWEVEDRVRTLSDLVEPIQSEGEFFDEAVFEEGPPWPTSPYANMGTLLANALAADDIPPPPAPASSGRNAFSYTTGIESLDYVGTASAYASASIAPVLPGYPTDGEPLGVSPFRYYPEDEPESAIDIEYEGDNPLGIPEWTAVAIDPTTTLTGSIFERIERPESFSFAQAVSRDFASEIRVAGSWPGPAGGALVHEMTTAPGDYTTVASEQRRALGSSVELTPHVSPAGAVIWLRTPDYVPASVAPDGGNGDWDWSYGWGFLRLYYRWTLRPPRYRWVYASKPIRRTYPRDDRRTWPPSKAVQSSGRTFGGYV